MAKGNIGTVVQVIGPVLDIRFKDGELPQLLNAVEVESGEKKLTVEVAQHIGDDVVRCIAMSSTDGLTRGAKATDTGAAITVPVGEKCLGRIFNLLGEPVDNQPAPQDVERWAIHRDPPPYDEQETSAEILETGIKVVDLIAPYAKGGKIGLFGGAGVGKTVLIMELINNVASVINADPRANSLLKVVFMPDYKVSLAEVLIPAANVSIQSSTAGFEASGTGNMKFALNGALTVGTYDGANIEIREAVGADNFYLFGLREEQIQEMRRTNSYNPRKYYEDSDYIKRILNAINSNMFCEKDYVLLFKVIYEELLNRDYYFILADLEAFTKAIHDAEKDYLDKDVWAKKAINNVARIGNFSSDRAVLEYADRIWHVKPV